MLVLQSLAFGLLVSLVALYANFLWSRRRLYHLASKIPGPRGLPLIGHGHKFVNVEFTQIFNTLVAVSRSLPSIKKIWLGPELLIFADTPESLQIVLNSQKCLDKSPLYDALMLTKGLVLAGGKMWKTHRKILNPSFSVGVLQNLIPIFDYKSKIFVKSLENLVGSKQIDIYEFVSACSLETLLKGTMDVDRDVLSDPHNDKYLNDCEIGAKIYMTKMLNVLYRFKPFYKMTKICKLEKKHLFDGVFLIADEIYNEYQAKKKESDDDDGYKKSPRNFINTLIDPKNGLDRDEVRDEINTFVTAGHETSALVISNTLLMLAIHPEVQQKVVEELKEVFGSADATIDYNSLNKLVYLDTVLKEVMRLFPVLPLSARQTRDEFTIGEHTIPAGATIVISAFTVQRNKAYWGDDAELFRPERFEAENFKKVPPYAYIPFTGGPRICIGWRYGMLFMKTVISNFLRRYKASTKLKFEELDYEITLSMKIVQRCMISLETREF